MDLVSLLFVSVICMFGSAQAVKSPSLVCLKRTLNNVVALRDDLCFPNLHEGDCTPRVLQVDGRDLNEALGHYGKGKHEYASVLFYADWCPFSRSARRMFNQLSILFPDVHHIAVESSALWPSELSEHGIRSLPALFVYENTFRFQFYGPRSIPSIIQFYEEKTGLAHFPMSYSVNQADSLPRRQESRTKTCGSPFVVWLRDDIFLSFAVFFLLLRCFWCAKPKIIAQLKHHRILRGLPLWALKGAPRRVISEQRRKVTSLTAKNEGKYIKKDDKESGKAVLSVTSWPSSSLAAVALPECSSIGGAAEDPAKKSVRGV